jgi:hypothetical protein
VPVRLTPKQRDLIIERTFIDLELERLLRDAEVEGVSVVAKLTLDEIDDLLGHVAAEANHSKEARRRKDLDSICERLRDVEGAYTDDPTTSKLLPIAAPPRYTQKQGQYLAFIYYYAKIHGEAPAEADMQRYFKVTPPSVHSMVLSLEQRGLIERTPGKARSIRLLIDRNEVPELE